MIMKLIVGAVVTAVVVAVYKLFKAHQKITAKAVVQGAEAELSKDVAKVKAVVTDVKETIKNK